MGLKLVTPDNDGGETRYWRIQAIEHVAGGYDSYKREATPAFARVTMAGYRNDPTEAGSPALSATPSRTVALAVHAPDYLGEQMSKAELYTVIKQWSPFDEAEDRP